jgi:glycerophosphoryl diester phosphodiesterase
VRITKDGVIIVAHDDNFHRLCGLAAGDKLVKDTDYKDLPRFKDQLSMHFSKNQKLPVGPEDQNYFSTLEEVFSSIPKEVVI